MNAKTRARAFLLLPLLAIPCYLVSSRTEASPPAAGAVRLDVRLRMATPEEDVKLHRLDPMGAVRNALGPALKVVPPRLGIESVRHLLTQRFGSVTETVLAPGYILCWNGERWVLVCVSSSSFEVDVPGRGKVIVEAEEREDM